MKLPSALKGISIKDISPPKRKAKEPNVFCTRCGFEWHDANFKRDKKRPPFCISCYRRAVAAKPSFRESIALSARAMLKRREKENKRKSKLR